MSYDLPSSPIVSALTLVNRSGAEVFNLCKLVTDLLFTWEDAVEGEDMADDIEAWYYVVPMEHKPATAGRPSRVASNGDKVNSRNHPQGRAGYNRDIADGTLRFAKYVWVADGVDVHALRTLQDRALTLQAVATRLMRLHRVTGEDIVRDLQIIEGELRFLQAEVLSHDPSLRGMARTSYPAYLFDRAERMRTDNAGYHTGDGSREDTDRGTHAVIED